MAKRILVSLLGIIAVLAGVMALGYAIEVIHDFWNQNVALRDAVLGEFIMLSMAFYAVWIGLRLLRSAGSTPSKPKPTWLRAVILGIGFFFPGFILSFPLTMLWTYHTWPGPGKADLVAMEVSVSFGLAASVICCIALLKKWKHQSMPAPDK
jgi:hypothetical protein